MRAFAAALTNYLNEPNVLQRKNKVYIVGSPYKKVIKENILNRGSENVELRALAPGFLKDL